MPLFASPMKYAVATAALLGVAACAGGPGGPGGGPGGGPPRDERSGQAYRPSVFLSGAAVMFTQFDADRDYATSRAEVETGAAAEWARVASAAPSLTPIAFETWSTQAFGGPQIGPYRLSFDTNVDGAITREEFLAAFLARFDVYDADKDGKVTRLEMVERLPEARGPGAGPGDPGGSGNGPGGGQRPKGRPPQR